MFSSGQQLIRRWSAGDKQGVSSEQLVVISGQQVVRTRSWSVGQQLIRRWSAGNKQVVSSGQLVVTSGQQVVSSVQQVVSSEQQVLMQVLSSRKPLVRRRSAGQQEGSR